MVCLPHALLFLRKRKTIKRCLVCLTGKGNIGGRKLYEKLEYEKRN